MIIYKITNLVNGKIYVGQTTRPLSFRASEHKHGKDRCSVLKAAIKKHGFENFVVEVLEECRSQDELNDRECYWILTLKSNIRGIGYNMTPGGKHAALSPESRLKLSLAKRGVRKTPETILRMQKAAKIRGIPESTRRLALKVNLRPVVRIDLITRTKKEYPSILSTKADGFQPTCVCACCRGRRRTYKGYRWAHAARR